MQNTMMPAVSFRHAKTVCGLVLACAVLALGDHTARAAQQYTVEATAAAGGSIYPPGKVMVDAASTPTFLAVAKSGYSILEAKANGVVVGREPFLTLPPVAANTKLQVTFVKNPIVTVSSTGGGAVLPAGKLEVPYGGTQVFTIAPDSGYEISSIKLGGKAQPIQSEIALHDVKKAATLAVTFKPLGGHILVTASAGKGGTIAPAGKVAVAKGGDTTFAIAAADGFRILDVKVNGKSVGAVSSYKLVDVQKAATIAASFTVLPAITVSKVTGGTISPAGKVLVPYGGQQVFAIEAMPGYTLRNLVVNGKKMPASDSYVFDNVTKNGSIGAAFAFGSEYVVVQASADKGGAISPSGAVAVVKGSSQEFTFQPASGYQVAKVLVNGKSVGNPDVYTVVNITKGATIKAQFAPVGHAVTASTQAGGKITPSGTLTVLHGKSQKFTVTPPKGFKAGLFVDGVLAAQNAAGKVLTYTLADVQGPTDVQAIYTPIGSQFAGSLVIGLVGLGESILVANSSPGAFEVLAEGSLGIKTLQCYSERLGKWFPVVRTDSGGTAEIPFAEGDNPLWFAAIANDDSIAWYPSTVTYYSNLDFTTPLTSSVDTLAPNQPADVRWTIGLLHPETAHVTLYAEDEAGQTTVVGQMYDNGILPDEIDGDGVFSGEFRLTAAGEGFLYYRAGVSKVGEDGYFSELVELWSTPPITDPQVTTAVGLADNARNLFDDAVASGKTPQEAAHATVIALRADPAIGVAGASEEGGVWWVSDDGILGCYAPKGQDGVRARGSEPLRSAQSRVQAPVTAVPRNAGSPNYYRPQDWNRLFPQSPAASDRMASRSPSPVRSRSATVGLAALTENRIRSDRAIINSPVESEFGAGDDTRKPWPTIENHATCGLYGAKKHVNQGSQYVSIVESFGDYGYIHICSHGDNFYNGLANLWKDEWGPNGFLKGNLSLVGLWSKAVLAKNTDGTWSAGTFADDLKQKRVAVAADGEVFLLPSFFSHHLPALPNSLVVLGACRSGYNSSLAKAFIAKGAASVIGYTDYVKSSYCQNTLQEIVDRMYEDATLDEAVDSARDAYGDDDADDDPAALVYFGDSDLQFPLSTLKNGGFEDGVLTPWAKAGDGRVLTALGSARPTEGTYMGVISTGLGYTTSTGSIEQRVCVPAAGGSIQLDWNFFSEEWMEWVGSIYQDTFEIDVAVVDPDGNRGPWENLFSQTIDGLASQVSPSPINFDQDGVYDTGWRTATLNADPYAGKTVFLRFYATDVGDSIFDSAILLDNIRLLPK